MCHEDSSLDLSETGSPYNRAKMDLGKYRRDRFGQIPAISGAVGALWVQGYREIPRTRGDFARFSALPENQETGWWMTQSAANQSLVLIP